jgi:ATP-dependent DNA ligase
MRLTKMKLKRLLKPATIDTEEQLAQLKYPLYVFNKYDGIRCCLHDGKLLTNTLKQVPNKYITEQLSILAHYAGQGWIDGELIRKDTKDFHKVQSIVMSEEHKEASEFRYVMFDRVLGAFDDRIAYRLRLGWLQSLTSNTEVGANLFAYRAPYILANSVAEVLDFEAHAIKQGFEGIVLRGVESPYKMGRATFKEGICYKFKRTDDAEATVLDCIELEHNLNSLEYDGRGLAKRSSHGANKIGSGMLGSFRVKGINGRYEGKEFLVSCGSMPMAFRQSSWQCRESYKNRIITYTFAKNRGTDDAPAEPRFKSFRDEKDI